MFVEDNMEKTNTKDINLIYQAVVSIYVQLSRIRHIESEDIETIDTLLTSLLGNELRFSMNHSSTKNILSIRQATNILKMCLHETDKFKLLLTLFSIVYMKKKFEIIGSLELIKFVDLLYIDIKIYEQLLDILEGKSNAIELDVIPFIREKDFSTFKNFLVFGEKDSCDVFIKPFSNCNLVVLMIKDFTLVGTQKSNEFYLNDLPLIKNEFYLMNTADKLSYRNFSDSKTQLTYDDITSLYQLHMHQQKQSIRIPYEDTSVWINYSGAKLTADPGSTSVLVNKKLIKQPERIAIDDVLIIEKDFSGKKLLLEKDQLSFSVDSITSVYVNYSDSFFKIANKHTSDTILKITKDNKSVFIQPASKQKTVFVNNTVLSGKQEFSFNTDVISHENQTFKINRFFDILKVDFEIKNITVENIYHEFDKGQTIALENINFELNKGELLAIMGPSGSGKTTLLKTFTGEILPKQAKVLVDGFDFYRNFAAFQKHIGYVPQDDLLFANLTVYQNLYYCARLRIPHLRNREDIDKRIDNILRQIGLYEKKHLRVGDLMNKLLSGGQRKRLNIALELLADPQVIILDEPTSGLSSKDSENLLEMLNDLRDQGKIIIATIHQPNPEIYQNFDKLLFLDKGGVQVYFGSTKKAFNFFNKELQTIVFNKSSLETKKKLRMPEFFFDIIEYSEPLISTNITDTEIRVQRKFPPFYWKNKYKKQKLLEIINQSEDDENEKIGVNSRIAETKLTIKDNIMQFYYVFTRNLINKLTNRLNIIVTFIASPMLAILVSLILRNVNENGEYIFGDNTNMPTFIFISVIIFIFLGLSNSLDELLSEKRIISRERKMNIKVLYVLISKNITLSIFNIIQVMLYVFISCSILEIRNIYSVYVLFLFLAGMSGFTIGLIASAVLDDRSALINVLPIVLIPQIMFAGAVIKFEDMNPFLRIRQGASVPEFCEIISSRWLFEGLAVAQAELNYYDKNMNRLSLARKNAKDYRTKSKLLNESFQFSSKHSENLFRNTEINNWVDSENSKYLNRNRNYFMATKMKIFNKEYNKYFINILVILIYSLVFNLIAFIMVRRRF